MVQQQPDPSQSALKELGAPLQPALPPSQQPISDQERASLHLDYEQTTELFRMLADIRFKLLAFVPTLTGIAISLLTGDKLEPGTILVVGILGFFVTLGIILYELRNSLFYDLSISRAARLERILHFPRFTRLRENPATPGIAFNEPGGVFTERPPGKERGERSPVIQYVLAFLPKNPTETSAPQTPEKQPARAKQDPLRQYILGFLPVKHDIGLSLVYGASLGGWTFIVIHVIPFAEPWRTLLSLLVGVLVAGITVWQFKRRDDERYIWQFGIKGIEGHVELDNLYQP